MEKGIIAGIDIGSSKITSVVAEIAEEDVIIRGINTTPARSVVKGLVKDVNLCAREIDASFSGAVYSSGVSLEKVYVAVSSKEMVFKAVSGELKLGDSPREITIEDVEKLSNSIETVAGMPGYELLQRIVQEYLINNSGGVRNPVGMFGNVLSLNAQDVLAPSWLMNNYRTALDRVGLEVAGIVPSILSASEAVLTDEERNTGCVIIDLGHGTTDIGIYRDGLAVYISTVLVGGANFDRDIMQGLGVGLEEAQRIKKAFVKAWVKPEQEELDDLIDVKLYGQREYSKIKKQKLIEVVLPRLEEWAALVKNDLGQSGFVEQVPGGIVLVGGGSYMREVGPFFRHHLKRAVRIGLPIGYSRLFDEFRAPQYASALGIANYVRLTEGAGPAFTLTFADEVYNFFVTLWKSMPWVKRKAEREEAEH